MKIRIWLKEDAVKLEAPTIAATANEIAVAAALLLLQGQQKLPAAFQSIIDAQDAQTMADVVKTILTVSAGVACDKLGFDAGTKGDLLGAIGKSPATIPVEKAKGE